MKKFFDVVFEILIISFFMGIGAWLIAMGITYWMGLMSYPVWVTSPHSGNLVGGIGFTLVGSVMVLLPGFRLARVTLGIKKDWDTVIGKIVKMSLGSVLLCAYFILLGFWIWKMSSDAALRSFGLYAFLGVIVIVSMFFAILGGVLGAITRENYLGIFSKK